MRSVFRVLSTGVLLGSATVILYTIVSEASVALRHCWPLHLGGVAVFVGLPLIVMHQKTCIAEREPTLSSREVDKKILAAVPRRFWFVGPAVAIALLAVALQSVGSPGGFEGYADRKGEKYILASHGRMIREISEAEFHNINKQDVRAVCVIWFTFSWLAAAYCWIAMPGPDSVAVSEAPDSYRPPAP